MHEEINILSKLKHKNCVKYYESFIEQNKVYIIMEKYNSSILEGLRMMPEHIARPPDSKSISIYI